MYYIKKYVNCWAIHNDETGASRPLTEAEKSAAAQHYPELQKPDVKAVYFDRCSVIREKP